MYKYFHKKYTNYYKMHWCLKKHSFVEQTETPITLILDSFNCKGYKMKEETFTLYFIKLCFCT